MHDDAVTPRPVRYVDMEAAREAPGLRLVVLGGVPSPWSEAAKALFALKGLDYVAVRHRAGDEEMQRWTGCDNAPVALYERERPRHAWADILALGERLAPEVPLLPADAAERARVLGLAHELLGEMGLVWCVRLLLVHDGLTSGGRVGLPAPVAGFLAPKYGYAPERVPMALARSRDILALFAAEVRRGRERGSRYLVGDRLTAVDIYAACALAAIKPMPEDVCRMVPVVRRAFDSSRAPLEDAFTPELMEQRDFIFRRHLGLPFQL